MFNINGQYMRSRMPGQENEKRRLTTMTTGHVMVTGGQGKTN